MFQSLPCVTPNRINKKISLSKRNVVDKKYLNKHPAPKKKQLFDPNFSTNILRNQNISKKKHAHSCLVGGFNPLEEYSSNWIISPGIRVKNQNI